MKKRRVMLALRVALACAALWALLRELSGLRGDAIVSQFRSFGWRHVFIGAVATAASFLVLAAIETLAVRQTRRGTPRVPAAVTVGTSFVANAMSQSIGLSVLTGAAVRARAYGRAGLTSPESARVTAFVTISATLGLMCSGAIALLSRSEQWSSMLGSRFAALPMAAALAAVVVAYVAWAAFGRAEVVGRGRWTLPRPSLPTAIAQVGLSTADLMLTGVVLFAFVPGTVGLSLSAVLGAYLIAQVAAVTSHVPAGAGVLEVVTIALLAQGSAEGSRAVLVAALVMFRVFYYVVPLVLAVIVAALYEWQTRRSRVGDSAAAPSAFTPRISATHAR